MIASLTHIPSPYQSKPCLLHQTNASRLSKGNPGKQQGCWRQKSWVASGQATWPRGPVLCRYKESHPKTNKKNTKKKIKIKQDMRTNKGKMVPLLKAGLEK